MKHPRKKHVGKSRIEKEAYQRMLKTQQREAPTYDEDESTSTDSVVKEKTLKSSITEPSLKPYHRESSIQWKEIIIVIIIFGITTVLFLFGMSLNREIGVIQERSTNTSQKVNELSEDMKKVKDEMNNVNLKLQLIENSDKNRNK